VAYDGAGSLFALGMRLTKLDDTGAPLVGANTCYTTEALVTVGIGLEYEEGDEILQRAGSGRICLYYKAPDTLKQGTISDLSVCSPDPNILQFLIGGDVIGTGGSGTAEVQTVTVTGGPTGGTFTLTFDGETTAPIDFDAVAADVQAALEGLPGVEVGEVTVTGTGPYTVTFTAAQGDVPQMTANGALLTGGTAPGVTVTTATPGDNLTDVGYRAPQVGSNANQNGTSIEFWSRAVDEGAFASQLPYFHWTLPRSFVRPSDAWTLSGEDPLLPGFEGFCQQNTNWGAGPADDWPYASDRVWQYARVASIPDLSQGFVAVS
jgi:hypothetical protein